MASTVLVCPECTTSSRTTRELPPQAKVRCPECGVISRVFRHGNGAIELRAYVPGPKAAEMPAFALPPRVSDMDVNPRRPLRKPDTGRPAGGYAPFERARSWLGAMTLLLAIGGGSFTAYWYCSQISAIQKSAGRGAPKGGIWKDSDDARRKDFQARQQKALARLNAKSG